MTEHATEVERLQRLYRHYYRDISAQERWSEDNPGNRAILAERRRLVECFLLEGGYLPLHARYILEVGCGNGKVLAALQDLGASSERLCGVDLVPERVEMARRRFPEIKFREANAESLPFDNASQDLVLTFTMFSSILDEGMAGRAAAEIRRVIKPGGALLWYDLRYNNPRNSNVRGRSETDILALFPDFKPRLRSLTLLPPVARHLGPLTSSAYPLLAQIPYLRTHYLGLLIKPR